jgi:hypothetical protein
MYYLLIIALRLLKSLCYIETIKKSLLYCIILSRKYVVFEVNDSHKKKVFFMKFLHLIIFSIDYNDDVYLSRLQRGVTQNPFSLCIRKTYIFDLT